MFKPRLVLVALATVVLAGILLRPASGQTHNQSGCSPLMVLGSYHMANPGLDSVNLQADDVLSVRRQQEIADVVDRLARFSPTIVAVEGPYRDTVIPANYRKFSSGQYTLGRNEVEQIGFRIAKKLNLPTVYPVDYPMFKRPHAE